MQKTHPSYLCCKDSFVFSQNGAIFCQDVTDLRNSRKSRCMVLLSTWLRGNILLVLFTQQFWWKMLPSPDIYRTITWEMFSELHIWEGKKDRHKRLQLAQSGPSILQFTMQHLATKWTAAPSQHLIESEAARSEENSATVLNVKWQIRGTYLFFNLSTAHTHIQDQNKPKISNMDLLSCHHGINCTHKLLLLNVVSFLPVHKMIFCTFYIVM